MAQNNSALLNKLFNDPKTGFVGADKLFKRAKQYNPDITLKQVKDFLSHNAVHQVFQKPSSPRKSPRIHGKVGHYQADLKFLTRYKKHNNNFHILLNVTKFVYSEALKDKTQISVLTALEIIKEKALMEGRPIKVLQTDNGREFQNSTINEWLQFNNITIIFCEKDDKKCLGVVERFNRTIKLMIEKFLTRVDSNRWIDHLQDFVQNYNSSFHSSIKNIPERLEIFDEVDLIRSQGKDKKFNIAEVLKVPSISREINNAMRKRQLSLFRADKRLREREGIEPNRNNIKLSRKTSQ